MICSAARWIRVCCLVANEYEGVAFKHLIPEQAHKDLVRLFTTLLKNSVNGCDAGLVVERFHSMPPNEGMQFMQTVRHNPPRRLLNLFQCCDCFEVFTILLCCIRDQHCRKGGKQVRFMWIFRALENIAHPFQEEWNVENAGTGRINQKRVKKRLCIGTSPPHMSWVLEAVRRASNSREP